jgi:hypothetical protein
MGSNDLKKCFRSAVVMLIILAPRDMMNEDLSRYLKAL